eukprot:361767-Chlamydomonas_euryale.AAC.16
MFAQRLVSAAATPKQTGRWKAIDAGVDMSDDQVSAAPRVAAVDNSGGEKSGAGAFASPDAHAHA